MKHSFQNLIADLKPAYRQRLIALYDTSDSMVTIRLEKDASCRIQLTKYINKHYNVKAQLHDTSPFSIHVHEA